MPSNRYPMCFLSVSLDPADAGVVEWFRKLVGALDFDPVMGDPPSTDGPVAVMTSRIQQSQGFVAILTRRSKVEGKEEWLAPTLVEQEIAIAHSHGKPIAAFVEGGVVLGGIERFVTSCQRWDRTDLASAAPGVVRYLVDLRNKVAPPAGLEGDVPTARALMLELGGIIGALESVEDTLSVPSWNFAYWSATVSGRLMMLSQSVQAAVAAAYGSLDSVGDSLKAIAAAREGLREKPRDWLDGDDRAPPLLPREHELWTKLRTERDAALVKTRAASLRLARTAYPANWSEFVRALKEVTTDEELRTTFGLGREEL